MNITNKGIVTGLNIFPVKSLRGITVQQAELTPFGLKWDRFWMVVNDDGLFMSQRNLPQMATIKTEITQTDLVLSHEEYGAIKVPLVYRQENNSQNSLSGKVWQSECQLLDEGPEVSQWLTRVIGKFREQSLRLVRLDPTTVREVSTNHTDEEQHFTYFADGYPYLVTTTESLTALNQKLLQQGEHAVPMSRFRANIVVSGVTPFIEHQTPFLQLTNDHRLHLCKPCERCKMTSIDQESGHSESPKQPIKTLLAMDHVQQKGAYFGHNAVLQNLTASNDNGHIAVGDHVEFQN